MAIKNNRIKTNLKLRLFLSFLLLAFAFWLLINLSKTYTSEVVFNVSYVNLPTDKEIQNEPPKELKATVNSNGFTLLKYKINKKEIQLDVSKLAYKKGSMFYYLPNKHLFEISSQLNVDTKVDKVQVDTIFLDLGINVTKKIPVKLVSDIQFKLGYHFTEDIALTPDSISIIGPESIVDSIHFINTTALNLVDVSADIAIELSLDSKKSSKVSLKESQILVSAKVDKFTEGSFKVPFEVLNTPFGNNLTTFPSEVEVVYQIGLSNFKKITPKDFNVYCDYSYSEENGLNYLIPKLSTVPSLITSVKIVPDKIEFLIQE